MDLLLKPFRGHISGFLTCSFFYGVELVTPHPPPTWRTRSQIYNPRDWVAQLYLQTLGTQFSRFLRRAWATVGLFFNPSHHTGYMSVKDKVNYTLQLCTHHYCFLLIKLSLAQNILIFYFFVSFFVLQSLSRLFAFFFIEISVFPFVDSSNIKQQSYCYEWMWNMV